MTSISSSFRFIEANESEDWGVIGLISNQESSLATLPVTKQTRTNVDWKPLHIQDTNTWPKPEAIVWLTDGKEICLVSADVDVNINWLFFDPYNVNGADRESYVDSHSATHWAEVHLPELPV